MDRNSSPSRRPILIVRPDKLVAVGSLFTFLIVLWIVYMTVPLAIIGRRFIETGGAFTVPAAVEVVDLIRKVLFVTYLIPLILFLSQWLFSRKDYWTVTESVITVHRSGKIDAKYPLDGVDVTLSKKGNPTLRPKDGSRMQRLYFVRPAERYRLIDFIQAAKVSRREPNDGAK